MGEPQDISRLIAENRNLKEKLAECEQLIKDLSAPIIPSIIPETILVPITGMLDPGRFEVITAKLTDYAHSNSVSTAVVDFTAISEKEIGEVDVFGRYIENVTATLNIMGVQVLYVGFRPSISRMLIMSGSDFVKNVKAFSTFRAALQYLMNQSGMSFTAMVLEDQDEKA
ncbi:hypothetical protein GKZ89_15445 [Bacillus mangrovi]|uniref:STAS domain-containing protein n=1 Tax=Metabacillus mangrovi TaxID=1491830 RepID=A0A7X2S703_9BACI|nr:STAS domain-containing protein [Metabacillus mangrovi]MTH54798.1 hypothetical protein [Metabacillus mangrovi]